jgi:hypothetical protein
MMRVAPFDDDLAQTKAKSPFEFAAGNVDLEMIIYKFD